MHVEASRVLILTAAPEPPPTPPRTRTLEPPLLPP